MTLCVQTIPSLYGIYTIDRQAKCKTNQHMLKEITTALAQGLRWLQARFKSPLADDINLLIDIALLTRQYSAQLIVNDHIDWLEVLLKHPQIQPKDNYSLLASQSSQPPLPGLHIGQSDHSLLASRQRLGPHICIGQTCHNSIDHAIKAQAQQASYVAFGRFFQSDTKPTAQAAELATLAQAHQRLHLPIAVIGGITATNIANLLTFKPALIAVDKALWQGQSIAQNYGQFITAINS